MTTHLFHRYAGSLLVLAASLTVHAQEAAREGIKVAVITNAGGAHLGAYFTGLAKTPEATSVVLADPDGASEAMAREALGDKLTAVYTDRDEMLAKEKPAMALVSVEAHQGPEEIGAALDAGCHVLAEKPACVRASDFAALVEKAESGNRHLMLALTNRLNPEVLKARALIAAGEIGAIYNTQVLFVKDQTRLKSPSHQAAWFSDKARAGGGYLAWLGIHWLDLAMYVTGSHVTHVAGFSGNVGGQPVNIEDSVAMSMQFDNGTFGTMTAGYYLKGGQETLLRIWGEKGWLEIASDAPGQVRWISTAAENPAVQHYDAPGGQSGYTGYVRACVRASAGLEAPPMTGRDGLRVLEAIFGFYDAAGQGKTVALD